MHLLIIVFLCLFGWFIFPRGFKFLVGIFVGLCGGGFFWGVAACIVPAIITLPGFACCIIAGIIAGCIFAAKG